MVTEAMLDEKFDSLSHLLAFLNISLYQPFHSMPHTLRESTLSRGISLPQLYQTPLHHSEGNFLQAGSPQMNEEACLYRKEQNDTLFPYVRYSLSQSSHGFSLLSSRSLEELFQLFA